MDRLFLFHLSVCLFRCHLIQSPSTLEAMASLLLIIIECVDFSPYTPHYQKTKCKRSSTVKQSPLPQHTPNPFCCRGIMNRSMKCIFNFPHAVVELHTFSETIKLVVIM